MIIERILILAIALQHAESQGETLFQPFSSTDWKFESSETMNNAARAIVKKVLSIEQAEGVGARVRRSVGRQEVCRLHVYTLGWGNPYLTSPTHSLIVCMYILHAAEKPGPLSHVG